MGGRPETLLATMRKAIILRVLVTGGSGYIGSHTLLALCARSDDPCVVDSFRNSSPKVLDRVAKIAGRAVEHHQLDIRDTAALDATMAAFRPDAVIHFAGLKAVGESEEIPLEYYSVNVAGTANVLAAMTRVGCKQFIFSSSATVYGEPEYLPFDEAHPCAPVSVYGRTKHMAEQIMHDWQKATPDAAAVSLRYFNPVGAHASGTLGESPRGVPNNLLPYVAQVAAGARAQLQVFGNDYDTPDGTGMRDYIHVEDLARAHTAALDFAVRNTGFHAFNIGTGTAYSVLDVISAFEAASGRTVPYRIMPRRAGDTARSLSDPAKSNDVLGWSAQFGLNEMCASHWHWQDCNPHGYDDAPS